MEKALAETGTFVVYGNTSRITTAAEDFAAFYNIQVESNNLKDQEIYTKLRSEEGSSAADIVSSLAFFPYLMPSLAFGAIYLAMSAKVPWLRGFLLLALVGSVKYLPFSSRSGVNAMLQLSGEIVENRRALHGQRDAAGRLGKLDRIGQDVDQNFLQLRIVADIVVVRRAEDASFVLQALVAALGHDHGVDLLQDRAEGEFLPAQHQTSGLDPAHIQDVIDQPQKMPRAWALPAPR